MVAKTSTERTRAYRKRLKESGGKSVNLDLPPEFIKALKMVEEQNYPAGFGTENTIKAMLNALFKRMNSILIEQIRLKEEFHAEDWLIDIYAEQEREFSRPQKAEDFMKIVDEVKEAKRRLENETL